MCEKKIITVPKRSPWEWNNRITQSWKGFLGGASGKESACQCRRHKRPGFDPWVRKISWRRTWQPTPVFLPGEFHGHRSLTGYSPWVCKESDMTEVTKHSHTVRGDPGERILSIPH